MTKPRVLVVDDNDSLSGIICENIESEGYAAARASSADEALRVLRASRPDVILLDLVLPDGDGLGLISRIRKCTDAPIIVISGKGAWVDKVVGLEMGADDYIGKPFEIKELLARIKAGVRRYRRKSANDEGAPENEAPLRVRFGSLLLDGARFQVFTQEGASCELTAMEFRLVEALVRAPNCVLSREQLLDRAHQGNLNVFDRAIDIQVARIRRKLGDDPKEPRIIRTVRGVGYALACETQTL